MRLFKWSCDGEFDCLKVKFNNGIKDEVFSSVFYEKFMSWIFLNKGI